jgi:hypothetical protein
MPDLKEHLLAMQTTRPSACLGAIGIVQHVDSWKICVGLKKLESTLSSSALGFHTQFTKCVRAQAQP